MVKDTNPNMYFAWQCHVLDMLYQMSSDNYVTVIKDVMCMQWYGQLSLDTPNMYFACQCHVLDMLYKMSSDNYVTVI